MKKLSMKQMGGLAVLVLFLAGQAFGGHRVEIAPTAEVSEHDHLVVKGLELAMAQEVHMILGQAFPAERLAAVARFLAADQTTLILGYSEVPVEANASAGSIALDVHVDTGAIRQCLRDMGVLATATASRAYVLRLVDVEPARTRRLGPLQEISGLRPVSSGGPELPVLELRQEPPGAWTGRLALGSWSLSRTAKSLEELWWPLWKEYFSRGGEGLESGLVVRVTGWLSSTGPMEFDRMLDSWTTEIEQKALVGVEMSPTGIVGSWKIRALHEQTLIQHLREAAKAQGLTLDVQ